MADGFIIEPILMLSKSRIVINVSKSLDFLDFRIAHISDTHFGFYNTYIPDTLIPDTIYSQVITEVRRIKPDVIAFTGDLISEKSSTEDVLEFVERLSRVSPVFIVWGNWDHSKLKSRLNSFKHELESVGEVAVMVNESIQLENGFYVIGVDDPFTGRDRLGAAMPAGNGFKILLAHSPQIINGAEGKAQIVLSGHTHGGQVVLPFVGPAYVPLPEKYRKYFGGLYRVGETAMYVNRGIGMSFLPVRFMCPPEIAEIEIKTVRK
jgi:hypothetical protein